MANSMGRVIGQPGFCIPGSALCSSGSSGKLLPHLQSVHSTPLGCQEDHITHLAISKVCGILKKLKGCFFKQTKLSLYAEIHGKDLYLLG